MKEKLAEYQKQIDKLTVLEIEVSFDTLFGQKSRDIFLFSYCVAGINFKDIYTRYSEIRREKPIMLTTDWETELAEAV